jgi:tetratricopeptide (TPR) repeat protein
MTRRSWVWGLVLVVAAGPALARGERSEADKLYKESVERLRKGDVQGAVDRLQKAVAIDRTAPLLFNLGQAMAKLGKLGEAKQILEEARKAAEERGPKSIVELATNALTELDQRMPRVIVELPADARDAQVKIDGKEVQPAAEGIVVEPGRHELAVNAPGFEPFRYPFTVQEGDRRRVTPELEPEEKSEHAAAAAPPTRERSITGPLVLGGAGVVALAGATYFFLKVSALDDERRRVWSEAGCPGPKCPSSEPSHAADLRKDAESKALIGNVLAVVGGAALIGAGAWYFLGKPSNPSSKEQTTATVRLAPAPGGAVLFGAF